MIVPTRQFVSLALVPLTLSLGLYVFPSATAIILVLDFLLAMFALVDFFTIPQHRHITVTRNVRGVATRGEKHPVELIIGNRTHRELSVHIRDDLDPTFDVEDDLIISSISPRSQMACRYQFSPMRRGEYVMKHVHLMLRSRFGLWKRHLKAGPKQTIRVYPALKQISRFAMYARQNKMSLLGLRRSRKVGNDNEFERLRDYTHDDQFKAIDWRATSRRLKLTVRDFQSNQSQRIIFMIDCGRMMVNESNGFSLFDAAIDAALTLGYVALSRQDQVGLMCFNSQVVRWIPPKAGRSHLNTLVHAVHNIEPELVESRFDEAFLHLHRHCRKRSLVVVLSNVIDDRNAQSIQAQTTHLVGQHLPMTVLFRDHELFQPIDHALAQPELASLNDSSLFRAAASADILLWREEVLTNMRHAGVLTLDVFPENLTAPLINEYLRIKAQMLL
ncbi:DUF58 domain-containing protein [uncultured Rubinisphaera sp.]|uniref:DUF58 domain-containing protein n=1 Tax=uncultured Rubinisphaera sp. TaxID=1678686 RepID=UPI0030DA646B